jgi:magnesium chelatase family protein
MDRIDLQLHVPPVSFEMLDATAGGEPSHVVRDRVARARQRQLDRFRTRPDVSANGHMGPGELRRWCRPARPVARMLQHAVDRTGLSARAYHRVLKVARTIADLAGAEDVALEHAAEAVQYRSLDRELS